MPLFKIDNNKLVKLNDKIIDLERDIQKITEDNLNEVFGLHIKTRVLLGIIAHSSTLILTISCRVN